MDTPGRSHELDNDNDSQKGATEENRPGPARSSHPGLDDDGLPNDPVAITQDNVGDVISDGGQSFSDVCAGDFAQLCTDAGITG